MLQKLRHLDEVTPVVVISGHGDDQHRRRSDQARRLRLHREAARAASACWSRCATPSITRRLQDREPDAASRDAEKQLPDRRRQRRRCAAVRERDPEGGADQRHRADLGRERRRQGAGRARDPPREPAARRAVRAGELRRDSRRADRVRAVRPREGLVHRRHRAADRQVRAGRQGHDLPRRSRRHEPEDAGQGAARAAGAGARAARQQPRRSRSTCA